MRVPLPHHALLTVLVGLMVLWCAVPSPERPIILRRPLPDRRAVRAPPRRPPVAPQAAPDPKMAAEQEADLFRHFGQYLAEPAQR
jgi:hypothetical protein